MEKKIEQIKKLVKHGINSWTFCTNKIPEYVGESKYFFF